MKVWFPCTRAPLEPAQIYYRIHESSHSQATPVVLLHGLMGFAANWGKVWPTLSEDRPVLVLDQCGHGKTAHAPKGYGPGDYAADLRQLLGHLGWSRAHIVGHSMGGRVALAFCSDYADHAASLCLEDSGTEANPSRVLWIEELLGSIPTPFANRNDAKKFFVQKYGNTMLGTFLFANLKEHPDGSMDWRFHTQGMIETIQKGRALDAMEAFKKLAKPIQLIRGGASEEFSEAEAERMVSSRDGVELFTIAEAGHFVHAEKPQQFTAALRDFLQRNDS